ncbi:MAG: hypothetical protein KTR30_19465 [Saprospiraceae bacterium]|nr:hypothetical protein [Saprospiraceae bacterium]
MDKQPTKSFFLIIFLSFTCLGLGFATERSLNYSPNDLAFVSKKENARLLVNRSSFSPASNPKPGQDIKLSVEIVNAGSAASPATVAKFRLPSGVSAKNGLSKGIPALGAGKSHLINFYFAYNASFADNTISVVLETPSLPGMAGLKKTMFISVSSQSRSVVRNQGSEVYWVSPDPDENQGAIRTNQKQVDLKVMALSDGALSKKNFAIRVNGRRAQGQKTDLSELKSSSQKDYRVNHSFTSGLELKEGRNEVQVVYYEEDGETVAAKTKTFVFYYEPPVKANLYLWTIGTIQAEKKWEKVAKQLSTQFKQTFEQQGANIEQTYFYDLITAKATQRLSLIKSLAQLERLPVKDNDWVVLYWATQTQSTSNQDLILQPSDFDQEYPGITGLELSRDVLKQLQKSKGKKILFLDTVDESIDLGRDQYGLAGLIRSVAPSVEIFIVDGNAGKQHSAGLLGRVLLEAMQNTEVEVAAGEKIRLGSEGEEITVEDLSTFIRARLSFLSQNSKMLLHLRGTEVPRERTLMSLGQ